MSLRALHDELAEWIANGQPDSAAAEGVMERFHCHFEAGPQLAKELAPVIGPEAAREVAETVQATAGRFQSREWSEQLAQKRRDFRFRIRALQDLAGQDWRSYLKATSDAGEHEPTQKERIQRITEHARWLTELTEELNS